MNPSLRRKLLLAAVGLLAASPVVGVAGYQVLWVPQQKLSDGEFLEHASQDELVEVSERVLSSPFAQPHDACLFLGGLGDVASVPALLRAVRRFGEPAGDGVGCTVLHCFDALRRVTGHDEGLSPRAWTTWWETTGSKLPRSAFPPRPVHVRRPPAALTAGPGAPSATPRTP